MLPGMAPRTCKKCGWPVLNPYNSAFELEQAAGTLRPVAALSTTDCHVFPDPELGCPGSPSRRELISWQPRDMRQPFWVSLWRIHRYRDKYEAALREVFRQFPPPPDFVKMHKLEQFAPQGAMEQK